MSLIFHHLEPMLLHTVATSEHIKDYWLAKQLHHTVMGLTD